MLQSKLFSKTKKDVPADEQARNAQLLIQAGYVFKEMAGVYSLLPLGVKVINKIENIIREEMNSIGGVEMKTSIIQTKDAWKKTNRWKGSKEMQSKKTMQTDGQDRRTKTTK